MLARAEGVARAPKFYSGPVDLRCDIRQSEMMSYSSACRERDQYPGPLSSGKDSALDVIPFILISRLLFKTQTVLPPTFTHRVNIGTHQ